MKFLSLTILVYIIITPVFGQVQVITGECTMQDAITFPVVIEVNHTIKKQVLNNSNTFVIPTHSRVTSITISTLGSFPIEFYNIPSKSKDTIDLGRLELPLVADRSISYEEYHKLYQDLLQENKDSTLTKSILEKKYKQTFVITCYPHYRPEFLQSLSHEERQRLQKPTTENSARPT